MVLPTFSGWSVNELIRRSQVLDALTSVQRDTWKAIARRTSHLCPDDAVWGTASRRSGGPHGWHREKLVAKFDKNEDGWLNRDERDAARAEAKQGGGGGPGPGMDAADPAAQSKEHRGARSSWRNSQRRASSRRTSRYGPSRAWKARDPSGENGCPTLGQEDLYDPAVVRTLFLTFERDDWESEMEDFTPTDVEVDATLEVDGQVYEKVGVGFRGASSFGMVPAGSKRSLNISIDMAGQRSAAPWLQISQPSEFQWG